MLISHLIEHVWDLVKLTIHKLLDPASLPLKVVTITVTSAFDIGERFTNPVSEY